MDTFSTKKIFLKFLTIDNVTIDRVTVDRAVFVAGLLLLLFGLYGVTLAQGSGPTGSYSEAGYDDELIRGSVGNLFRLIEGAFGALIMVVAGLAAIIAAALGSYRAAISLLVVAVGSFILRALVSLFFGTDYAGFES